MASLSVGFSCRICSTWEEKSSDGREARTGHGYGIERLTSLVLQRIDRIGIQRWSETRRRRRRRSKVGPERGFPGVAMTPSTLEGSH